jgi:hypothetical protein
MALEIKDLDLGQTRKCGRVKPVDEIPTLSLS